PSTPPSHPTRRSSDLLRLAHARPAKAELERDDRGVSSLDVHGAGSSRSRSRSAHRSRGDPVCEGSGDPRDAPPRVTLRRVDLPTSRLQTNDGDAVVPRGSEPSTPSSSPRQEKGPPHSLTNHLVSAA